MKLARRLTIIEEAEELEEMHPGRLSWVEAVVDKISKEFTQTRNEFKKYTLLQDLQSILSYQDIEVLVSFVETFNKLMPLNFEKFPKLGTSRHEGHTRNEHLARKKEFKSVEEAFDALQSSLDSLRGPSKNDSIPGADFFSQSRLIWTPFTTEINVDLGKAGLLFQIFSCSPKRPYSEKTVQYLIPEPWQLLGVHVKIVNGSYEFAKVRHTKVVHRTLYIEVFAELNTYSRSWCTILVQGYFIKSLN